MGVVIADGVGCLVDKVTEIMEAGERFGVGCHVGDDPLTVPVPNEGATVGGDDEDKTQPP